MIEMGNKILRILIFISKIYFIYNSLLEVVYQKHLIQINNQIINKDYSKSFEQVDYDVLDNHYEPFECYCLYTTTTTTTTTTMPSKLNELIRVPV
jgi:hypothetical protein